MANKKASKDEIAEAVEVRDNEFTEHMNDKVMEDKSGKPRKGKNGDPLLHDGSGYQITLNQK